MSSRLWDKGERLNAAIHAFTVGDDPTVDRALVRWDAIASAAHAKMLGSIGILPTNELERILLELRAIREQADGGTFVIPVELEDCHTAIESRLVERCGEAGKRIHTGRSRNDQVLVAMRLYLKSALVERLQDTLSAARAFQQRIHTIGDVPMPGYTHMQPAMPSSVAQWLHAFLEWQIDLARQGLALYDLIDANPLGSGSGFGVSLPIDRAMTSKAMGFGRTHRNAIEVQNSRGRYELFYLRWCSDVASMAEKFAWDCILYSMKEFSFFRLPEELTTGSSIMPQKRNPDVLELLRASASRARALEHELMLVISKLPSNYHRDLQYTKRPVLAANELLSSILPIASKLVDTLEVDGERLKGSMGDELYATYAVFRKVAAGAAFRDAYRETADDLAKGRFAREDLEHDFTLIREQGEFELVQAEQELRCLTQTVQGKQEAMQRVEDEVFKL